MPLESTLAIIKPDAVAKGHIGEILTTMEENDFRVVQMRMLHLTTREAEAFYQVHKERPFFSNLVAFMTEGPVVVVVLEREQAVAKWREIMGATNPAGAAEGTIRKRFAHSIERNAVHGSDAPVTAAEEIAFFRAAELL